MRVIVVFFFVHGLAAVVPLLSQLEADGSPMDSTDAVVTWPQHFEGRPLRRLELSATEKRFGRDFPGHIARFTDGRREIVMRRVNRPSRKLHPAADCFKGAGYTTLPQPIRVDTNGSYWGCFIARQNGRSLHVCERVSDTDDNSWSDVSSWYWAAVLGNTTGPWWAITVAEGDGISYR